MIIGYLKSFEISEKAKCDIKNQLEINEEIEYSSETSLINLVNKLKNKIYSFIILPSRLSYTNDVSPICLDLILRAYGDGINEIFSNLDKCCVYTPSNQNEKNSVPFGSKYFKRTKKFSHIKESERNYLEYKVFKLNNVKTKRLTKVVNFLFTNKFMRIIFDVLSAIISSGAIAFIFLNIFNVIGNFDLVGQILSTILLIVQVVLRIFNFEKIAEKKTISGYWLYYSFEDTYELGNYVPKGFTTRLLEIKTVHGELSMNCGFAGSDTLFWESGDLNFDYNPSSKIARGFYSYNSNIVNAKGKRPEGTCMFKGQMHGNNQIMYMDGWFSGRGTMINGRVKYVRIEKNDYDILSRSFPDRSTTFKNSVVVVGIFGNAGSNTDYAFDKEYENMDLFKENVVVKKFYDSFESMYVDLSYGKVNMILVPFCNKDVPIKANIFNSKNEVKKVFLPTFEMVENSERSIKIHYVLCTNNKNYILTNKTRYLSNKEALNQCSNFISGHETSCEFASTSEAARSMSLGECDKDDVVICNEMAANIYGLYCLRKNGSLINPVNKEMDNITKFILIKKK